MGSSTPQRSEEYSGQPQQMLNIVRMPTAQKQFGTTIKTNLFLQFYQPAVAPYLCREESPDSKGQHTG